MFLSFTISNKGVLVYVPVRGIRHCSVMPMLKLAGAGLEVKYRSPKAGEGWQGGQGQAWRWL